MAYETSVTARKEAFWILTKLQCHDFTLLQKMMKIRQMYNTVIERYLLNKNQSLPGLIDCDYDLLPTIKEYSLIKQRRLLLRVQPSHRE
jgi:hypothetical protein